MKSLVIAAGIAFALTGFARAETTVIEHAPAAGVVVEHHDAGPVIEHREVETTDCAKTTVHKEDDMGNSKTVTKKSCD